MLVCGIVVAMCSVVVSSIVMAATAGQPKQTKPPCFVVSVCVVCCVLLLYMRVHVCMEAMRMVETIMIAVVKRE